MEDDIGEPAIAFHAAHDLDVLEDEVEVGIELGIVEYEGAVLGALGDDLLDVRVDVFVGEDLVAGGGLGLLLLKEFLRLGDIAGGVLEEGGLRALAGEAVDLAVLVRPIHRAIGADGLPVG